MKIPDTVKIGAKVYKVQQNVSRLFLGNGVSGEIDYSEQEIRLRSDGCSVHRESVFLHEIIHGIVDNAGYTDHDEGMISRIALGLHAFIVDNPGVFEEGETQ